MAHRKTKKRPQNLLLALLVSAALLLSARLVYFYLADADRFPITTIKISAPYDHLPREVLEQILNHYVHSSFFAVPVIRLQRALSEHPWVDTASVERIWPDTLKIKINEKKPVAFWNDALMTEQGQVFQQNEIPEGLHLPKLKGPPTQSLEVLQVYEKLSKILQPFGLRASGLSLSDNQAWVLIMENDVTIYLGKKDLETRLERFCRAYPAVFSEKADQLVGVDLRYTRGMAVQWKQQLGQ